jgi:hypothetical protein
MVIRHVLQYLIAHPEAKDTMQGILRWWLPGGIGAWEEAAVQEALAALVARGWVTQRQLPSSQHLYGVNNARLEEIQGFLRELESGTEGQKV